MAQHDIPIVSIFQEKAIAKNEQGIITNYSSAQGIEDAEKAILAASSLNQPIGATIYYAVETDLGTNPFSQNSTTIHNYLSSVASVMQSPFSNPRNYSLGVYGPENTCKMIKDNWFSNAFTMFGRPYSYTFTDWTIKQDNSPNDYVGALLGLVDFNVTSSSNYGGWIHHRYPNGWINYGNSARHRKKCVFCNQYAYEPHFPDNTGMHCVKCGYSGLISFPQKSGGENE